MVRQRKVWWERREEITARYLARESIDVIAAEIGITRLTLLRRLRTWAVPKRGNVAFPLTLDIPNRVAVRAYIAGILDGEGTIALPRQPNRTRANVIVSIGSTTRELHDWLLTTIGGHCYERTSKHLGKKPMWYWQIARIRDVDAFLRAVHPYLIIKRELADEALALTSISIARDKVIP